MLTDLGHMTHRWIALVFLLPLVLVTASCSEGPLVGREVPDRTMSVVEFSKDGRTVATISVRTDELPSGTLRLMIEIPWQRSRVDSVTFVFTGNSGSPMPLPIAYQASSYAWTQEFNSTSEGVRFHVPDTGFYGNGTMNFEFTLPKDAVPERGIRLQATLDTEEGEAAAFFEDLIRAAP